MNNRDMPANPVIDYNGEPLKVVVIGQDDPENKGFSTTNEMNCIGLTKLEAFTMAAMQGLLANPELGLQGREYLAEEAIEQAKLTLKELESNG